MRVITGNARGRKLKELPGRDTRPTTDKVKEAIFNIVQFDIEGRRVLDLFAGTGQLGIEALSRGAASCVFVDQSRQAAALVRDNLAHTRLEGQVVQADALDFLRQTRDKFDLIFLDPPYASGLLERALTAIASVDIVSEGGIIVCECAAGTPLPALDAPCRKQERDYRYGRIQISIYRRESARQDDGSDRN